MAPDANKIHLKPVHPDAQAINDDLADTPVVTVEDIAAARLLAAARGENLTDLRNDFDRALRTFAGLLQTAGPAGISPADLHAGSKIGRTSIHAYLPALIKAGAVMRVASNRAEYTATGDVWAALVKIRQGNAALAETAGEMTKV